MSPLDHNRFVLAAGLRWIGAAAVLCLVGCTVGPDYHAPVAPAESSFTPAIRAASPKSAGITAATPEAQWWRTLGDPMLDEFIKQAAASNLDYRIARLRVREARAALAYAQGGLLPRVNGSADYSHNHLSKTAAPFNAFDVPGFPWEFNQYQMGFDASWELDLFGGVRRGIEAARADTAAQDAQTRGVLLSITAELARNYVELRGYQRRYAIAAKNLHDQRQTLELTRDRQKQGLVTGLDVARAASQVERTESQLPAIRREELQAMDRIALLLGRTPESVTAQLSPPRPIPVPPPRVAIGVPAELLRRRPDIQQAERRLAAATARIGQATADLLPKLSLSGSFAFSSATVGDLFGMPSQTYGLGPTVTVPLFNAGRLRAIVHVRDAQQEQALAAYQQTVLASYREVHDALAAYLTQQDRRRSLARAVQQDQTAVELAQSQYKQGLVDFLDVLDTQRSLYESQDALAQSDQSLSTSLIALYKALGGGFPIAPQPAAKPDQPAPRGG